MVLLARAPILPLPPCRLSLSLLLCLLSRFRYPFDYAASEFGVGRQFNPTKLFIDTCAALGLVYNRKRATGAWMRLREERIKDVAEEESKKAA